MEDPTAANATIRDYADADFEGAFAVAREIVSLPPHEEVRRELEEYPAKRRIAFVATDPQDRIVAYAAASHPYWNRVGIFDYLVVAPASRRRGIGAQLIRRIESAARDAGLRRLWVQTISWNADGARFYERLGCVRRADLPGYFDDEHAMVWLDRPLTQREGYKTASP